MSKVIQVEGNLQFEEEDSSDSEEEDNSNPSDDAPLVFDDDGSDEEELEVFQPAKQDAPVNDVKTSDAPRPSKNPVTVTVPEKSAPVEKTQPLSLLSAMASAVQAIEDENQVTTVKDTEDDEEFSRLDAARQREATREKQQGEMRSGFNETFDCSRSDPSVSTSHGSDSTDTFGIAYKPFMKKKNSYEMPKGPAFEDEVEFERELLSSATVTAATLATVSSGQQDQITHDVSDDEFDFEEVAPGTSRGAVVLPKFDVEPEPEPESEALKGGGDEVPPQSVKKDHSEDGKGTATDQLQSDDDFRESSRKALEEIKEVYSSGLGDHEIVLLKAREEQEKSAPLSSDAIVLDMTKGSAIEEVDEEELERLEEEEAQREQDEATNEQQSRAALQSQWDNVDILQSAEASTVKGDEDGAFEIVKYAQVEAYFRGQDLSDFSNSIVIDAEASSSWSLLGKSSKLSKASIPRQEIELPFLIAQVAYSPIETPEHLNFLRNIYKSLVRNMPVLPPPLGGHWEVIGFQGLDPSTDLNRSMKMLSIVQVLHMLEKESSITQSLYNNSLGTSEVLQDRSDGKKVVDTSWPFMCVAIGMTKNSIDALRSGALTKYAIRYKSALKALHEYHHACFYCFLRSLQENPHVHHAEHLNTIRKEVSNNPLGLLRAYRKSKDVNNKEKDRLKKKSAAYGDDGSHDNETTSMYDVSSENVEGEDGGSEQTPSGRRRGSWKQLFSKKDDRAKNFMA
mmetsp:Transcript_22422/g.37988  ORF Transcript_22422/g.37988 Transcript_22422/m.37988 type:complete len:736 (-) Transcript_22422:112-2319(-)